MNSLTYKLVVPNDTPLGNKCLSVLARRYAGPTYKLDDIDVEITVRNADSRHEFIDIDFWDMNMSLSKSDRGYDELKSLFDKEYAKQNATLDRKI